MLDLQTIQQAAEAGKEGTKIFPNIGIFGLIITNIGLITRELIRAKKYKKNGIPIPGMGTECLKHRDKLVKLETEQENTDEDIKEIKTDVKEVLKILSSRN